MKLSECWKGRVVTLLDIAQQPPGPQVGHIDQFAYDQYTQQTKVCVDWGLGFRLQWYCPEQLTPYED